MFELGKVSLFFEQMEKDYPEVVQNIEIVHENKLLLDESYHNPKHFILNLNNSLRSLLFLFENSLKNSPDWLHDCVVKYRDENLHEYNMLKRLRDVSVHQALIFPAESILSGLYRIKSSKEYVAKIGFGDISKPGNYSWDLAMKNTDEIFHDLLVFHSLMFMDLEHMAIGECLGLTRKWFFHIKFSNKTLKYDEVVDVYELLCNFSSNLLDSICSAYANKNGIEVDIVFHEKINKFNCINTLLEIDLYPSLFTEWWGESIYHLNYGIRSKKTIGESIFVNDKFHYDCYKNLCKTPEDYKKLLEKYRDLPTVEYINDENYMEFYSFICLNHWHFNNSFSGNLLEQPIGPSEIMQLQRIGKILLEEIMKKKLCTISSRGDELKNHFNEMIKKFELK